MKRMSMFKPVNPLGRTGFVATALGIGDLADRKVSLDECIATARRAVDAGLNLIDTAPGYENGYSEEIVGRAVEGLRDRMFVIDKIDRIEEPVGPQVDESLARLNLDHVDLFVFHGLSSMDLWNHTIAPGGGMDQLEDCRRAGKVRFRGISSHDPDVLRQAILSGTCDVVMFAIGPYVHPRYVVETLPLARKHGVGTVCFKTFGAGKLISETSGYNRPLTTRPRGKVSSGGASDAASPTLLTVTECVHYTLTVGPDVALLGMSFPNEMDAAFEAARSFRPLSEQQMGDIRRRATESLRGNGKHWWNPGGE